MRWGSPGLLVPPFDSGLELILLNTHALLRAVKIPPHVVSPTPSVDSSVPGKAPPDPQRSIKTIPSVVTTVTKSSPFPGGIVSGAHSEDASLAPLYSAIKPSLDAYHTGPSLAQSAHSQSDHSAPFNGSATGESFLKCTG